MSYTDGPATLHDSAAVGLSYIGLFHPEKGTGDPNIALILV